MKKIIINIAVLLFLLKIQCSDENGFFDPTLWSKSFKGITHTDNVGNILGGDLSDWCYGGGYTFSTANGFESEPAQSNSVQETGSVFFRSSLSDEGFYNIHISSPEPTPTIPIVYAFGPAYPNPVHRLGVISVTFSLPKSEFGKIYVLNEDYTEVNLLISKKFEAGIHKVEWNLTNNAGQEIFPGVYRMIFESDTFYCQGDIWVK